MSCTVGTHVINRPMDQIKRKVTWAAKELAQMSEFHPELPWRKNKTPYKIFLAEVLLVRTRADVVERVYPNILNRYPKIRDLAHAKEDELLKHTRPLGLKKRVPLMIEAAKHILEYYNGVIPQKVGDLRSIPGLGQYTAAAIAVFAFDEILVPSDVNIFRFLARFTGLDMGHKTKGSKELLEFLPLLNYKKTSLKAEVLLDFCRLICRPRKPECQKCLLVEKCVYYEENDEKQITTKKNA